MSRRLEYDYIQAIEGQQNYIPCISRGFLRFFKLRTEWFENVTNFGLFFKANKV